MAKVTAAAWFPRSYIHLFETYIGLKKVELDIADVEYGRDLSFTIRGYKNDPDIRFTQEWSGLHYFTAEMPDVGLREAADQFMKDMQVLLLEKILKACHSVTYKQIVADVMPLDFHMLVLTYGDVKTEGYTVREAGDLRIAYRPEDFYYSGTASYVIGSDDTELLRILLYHAYTEIAFDFTYSMMKAMIRLYHEADGIVSEMEAAKRPEDVKGPMDRMDGIVKECSERYGKLKHAMLNLRLKREEYDGLEMTQREREVTEALNIPDSFRRLNADFSYMEILWSEVLEDRLGNIDRMMDNRAAIQRGRKGGWL